MSHLLAYFKAQSDTRAATCLRDYASETLKNAQIMERLAEIKSQHEPLNGLLNSNFSARDRLYAAAFYVAIGRMPSPLGMSPPDQGGL